MMEYMDSGYKKFTTVHDRLALEMNRCLQEAQVPVWMTKGKTTLIQKRPPKRNLLKQLLTHNVPTYDVENTNGKIKERDSFLANELRIVP